MPTTMVHWAAMWVWIKLGRGDVDGRRITKSQDMLCARSWDVEMVFGRIIHRIMREVRRGSVWVFRRVRKVCRGVEGVRERRCRVQRGIL